MALLGQLIKSAVKIASSWQSAGSDPAEIQLAQLQHLLTKAQNTSFGIYYGFDQILQADDILAAYRERVPIHTYDDIHQRWWQQQQNLPNITWPGRPQYFALSSGTTGKKSKRIPVTDDMLASFRAVGVSQAVSLGHFDVSPELFEKEVLMLSSSADLSEHKDHLEGEISGINASNLPPWFGNFYRPGPDIAQIDDWDERVAQIAEKAPQWDIGAIAGIPAWVQMMLETIIERHQLDTIHDIWPGLRFYVTGGVAFDPYRASFEKLVAQPLTYLDTYLASEGFFAFTQRPGTMDMRLALEHQLFYEFIPFDKRGFDETGQLLEQPEVHTLHQVVEGQDYALLISTPAGAWRYLIGDTVKFTDLEQFELVISGRTKYFLNVVGSQLSEEKINTAVQQLAKNRKIEIHEFAVAALQNEAGDFYHQWVLGMEPNGHSDTLKDELDTILQELNKNYRVARQKALKEVRVQAIPTETIYDWLAAKKKKGGQIKMPKVMKAEMMEDLLAFVQADIGVAG